VVIKYIMLVKFLVCDCVVIVLKLLHNYVGIFSQCYRICNVIYYIILTGPLGGRIFLGSCNSVYVTY
jgi:hypothetical protein